MISIHAPRVGSDTFLPAMRKRYPYFNPRSPCGERLERRRTRRAKCWISIHAPRVGSDETRAAELTRSEDISIHAPRVGSDKRHGPVAAPDNISIHAPRVGSDQRDLGGRPSRSDFNPRSPCGERHKPPYDRESPVAFQSTLPVWGATASTRKSTGSASYFNPRSPCGERPGSCAAVPAIGPDFNPRSPCGERPAYRGASAKTR